MTPINNFKIKSILNNNWEEFKIKHFLGRVSAEMLDHVIDQVEKSMECGNPENGYAKYKCLECGQEHIVSFICKSAETGSVPDLIKSM